MIIIKTAAAWPMNALRLSKLHPSENIASAIFSRERQRKPLADVVHCALHDWFVAHKNDHSMKPPNILMLGPFALELLSQECRDNRGGAPVGAEKRAYMGMTVIESRTIELAVFWSPAP